MIQLNSAQEQVVARALNALPLHIRDDAQRYIESRLRPVLQLETTDVQRAANAALARYTRFETQEAKNA